MRVGLIGTGRMGSAIGRRLVAHGHALSVWNRTREHAQALAAAGAVIAASPAALAAEVEIVLTLVSGDAANDSVYAALASAEPDAPVVANLSTLDPGQMGALASRIGAQRFVEAPVLGTAGPAERGELLLLAGGETQAIERATPVFACFSRRVVATGAVGTASAMKLVHNTILSLYWAAVGEAFEFGAALGLGLDAMVSVIGDSAAANGQWKLKAPSLLGLDPTVGFALGNLPRELGLTETLFERAGVPPRLVGLARERAERAVAAGWAEADVCSTAIFTLPERRRS